MKNHPVSEEKFEYGDNGKDQPGPCLYIFPYCQLEIALCKIDHVLSFFSSLRPKKDPDPSFALETDKFTTSCTITEPNSSWHVLS